MRHLRADYDAIQPWPVKRPHIGKDHRGEVIELLPDEGTLTPLIPDDEPVFLIRGQDPIGAQIVREYADAAEKCGADQTLVQRVWKWADEMDRWASDHPHGEPDVPEGMLR